jgi:hypothetical protein
MSDFSKTASNSISNIFRRRITPPIPFKRPERKELRKGEYQTYRLRNNSAEENSPTYELYVPYFISGTCKEWILIKSNLQKVLVGQNVKTALHFFSCL